MATVEKKLNIVAASKSGRKARRRGEFITFHPTTGKIVFSLSLVDKLGIKEHEFIEFLFSEINKSQWYIRVGTENMPEDTKLKLTKPSIIHRRDYCCTSKGVVVKLLQSAGISTKNSRSFKLMEQEPNEHEGNYYYELDTQNPL